MMKALPWQYSVTSRSPLLDGDGRSYVVSSWVQLDGHCGLSDGLTLGDKPMRLRYHEKYRLGDLV